MWERFLQGTDECFDIMVALQSAGRYTAGASSYVIAQARARFANSLGLEMKGVELIPNKMAGKSEAELRGDSPPSFEPCILSQTLLITSTHGGQHPGKTIFGVPILMSMHALPLP